jgi:hypothetical protein
VTGAPTFSMNCFGELAMAVMALVITVIKEDIGKKIKK